MFVHLLESDSRVARLNRGIHLLQFQAYCCRHSLRDGDGLRSNCHWGRLAATPCLTGKDRPLPSALLPLADHHSCCPRQLSLSEMKRSVKGNRRSLSSKADYGSLTETIPPERRKEGRERESNGCKLTTNM